MQIFSLYSIIIKSEGDHVNKLYKKNSYSISRYYHRFFLSGCEKERYYKYTLVLDNAFNTINKVDIFTLGKTEQEVLKKSGTTSIKYCSIWITNLTFRIEAITSLRI